MLSGDTSVDNCKESCALYPIKDCFLKFSLVDKFTEKDKENFRDPVRYNELRRTVEKHMNVRFGRLYFIKCSHALLDL